jgi:hypothetical protein
MKSVFPFLALLAFSVGALAQVGDVPQVKVTIATPTDNSRAGSPAKVVASGVSLNTAKMSSMAIFVDSKRVFFQWGDTLTAYLWLQRGWHNVEVRGTNESNQSGSQTIRVYSGSGMGSVTKIEDMDGWNSCMDPGCSGGKGTATAFDAAFQTTPSRDGSSRQFSLTGGDPYSNAYWYKLVGGSSTATNFIYDLWARVDNPNAPQALEFDVNQSFDDKRWVFGTQCAFKGSKKWDVWDGSTGRWVPTAIPCTLWKANTWVHVVWAVVRTGDSVRYLSLTLNGRQYPVNMTLGLQPSWPGSDIDVAIQLDGDAFQTPYNVWVDQVRLTAW